MSTSSATAATAATAGAKICFNTYCKDPKSEPSTRRRGWRLRTGELADLCDRCSTSYEQGNFCETFHSDGDGWRKCETCGKRVHCGCIVSSTAFAHLDAGGIECISCAQKSFVMGPNQMWSSSLFLPSERLKELPGKSWSQLSTSNPVPGQWRQAPNAWSAAVAAQSELHQRLSFEFDRPNSIEKLIAGGRSSVSDKRKVDELSERPVSTGLTRITIDRLVNGNSGLKPSGFNAFHRDDGSIDRLQESGHHVGDGDPIPTRKGVIHGSRFSSSAGIKIEKVPSTCINVPLRPPMLKDDPAAPVVGSSSAFSPSLEINDQVRISANQAQCQTPPSSVAKQLYPNPTNGVESTGDSQAQIRNGRPRVEGRGRNQLLPRYWPRITDQELQQISGDSNSVITPLFEKMLSASDAGRIGRLVLPKKCAEAYFPSISQPEGLPLKVQDASGKEWVFQFRFWPNNNSRMYVLEGVTPCIQSMQLQAGDTVTFSRIDPEGKLVMGFRKASNIQSEQALKSGNGISSSVEASNRSSKQSEMMSSVSPCAVKGSSELTPSNPADRSTWSKLDKAEFIQKERPPMKSPVLLSKRKNSTVGMKSKRLRIENEDSIELKLTWEEAQELLRPPTNRARSVVVIEGHEFEEYEEAPVLGKPTIFTKNQDGGMDQWAQCEDCLKWRRLPVDALLPPRWTCSDNFWDSDRSSCVSAQEISKEQLADLLPFNTAASRKSKAKIENDTIEGSDGLDTLANLAILGEGESPSNPSQATTKHPRHRPGCTCIVCIQPPSGKGPKHKQTCCCNVCLTVKRRFRTLMLRKEKRQSEKEAETARKKQQQAQSPEASTQQEVDKPITSKSTNGQTKKAAAPVNHEIVDEDCGRRKELLSPVKTEIDLNMQPEREEETSPVSDTDNAMRLIQNATS